MKAAVGAARLGLGTVQLGTPYGVAGDPFPDLQAVRSILDRAARAGVRDLDTAPVYGESEARLGACAPERFRIVTKTPSLEALMHAGGVSGVRTSLEATLGRLGAERVHALLVHAPADLASEAGPALFAELARVKDEGLVQRIGVSARHPEELDLLLERYPLELVQLPLSLLDQRFLTGGQLARLAAAGVEVHARSIFLQGLLLMDPERVPAHLAPVAPRLRALRSATLERGSTPLAEALGFVRAQTGVDVVLCGVHSAAQLEGVLAAWQAAGPHLADARRFALDDLTLMDPARWAERGLPST